MKDEQLNKELSAVIEETKKQNEKINFQNLIDNIFKFGFEKGRKSVNPKSIIANTLVDLFNDSKLKPQRNDVFFCAYVDNDDPTNIRYEMNFFADGEWVFKKNKLKPKANDTMYWIDVNTLLKMKMESLKKNE